MKKSIIYTGWGVLYCLCVGFSFIPNPQGAGKALLVMVSLLFFVPPFVLLFLAKKENSRKSLSVLRLLSICGLGLALIPLVLNFLWVDFSADTGRLLYVALVVFTVHLLVPLFRQKSLQDRNLERLESEQADSVGSL